MCQSVNSFRKIAVWNVGCVSAYFCGGRKINLRLWFRRSFKNGSHATKLLRAYPHFLRISEERVCKYMFENIFVKKQRRYNKILFPSKMNQMNNNVLYEKSEKAEKATECSSSKQVLCNSVVKSLEINCEEVW